jgi:hypothetical protein
MATKYFIGNATSVAQVTSVQITGYDVATTYKITVGGVVISTVGTGGTAATTAAALAAAWNASTHVYCTPVTAAAVATDTITFTADTAGMPFEISSSVTGGGGTIGAATQVTANASPFDFSTAANWSDGATLANSDNGYLRNYTLPILWGLSQSAITPTLLSAERSFTGQLGLYTHKLITAVSSTGVITYNTSYPEYRQSSLATGAATIRIGETLGSTSSGSPLIKIDSGTTNVTQLVYSTGRSANALPSVLLKGNHASAVLNVYGSSVVGVGYESPADMGEYATITNFGGQTFIGPGITTATIDVQAGIVTTKKNPTTIRIEKPGFANIGGTQTITTFEKRGNFENQATYAITSMKS